MDNHGIKLRLADFLVQHDITQTALAAEMGCPKQSVNQMCRPDRIIGLRQLGRICLALNALGVECSPENLYTFTIGADNASGQEAASDSQ